MMIETRGLSLAPIFVLTVARNRDDLGVPASLLLPEPLGDVEAACGFRRKTKRAGINPARLKP
jgi:hypothetical protein